MERDGMDVPFVSRDEMLANNVSRASEMRGSPLAFLDMRMPGHERENINIIGLNVTENMDDPALDPIIKAPAHGFSVGYIRARNGRGAALHAHETEEVFVPIRGQWEIYWLAGEEEQAVTLDVGDVVNVPLGIYRGFRCACDDPEALMLAVVGGPDAGKPNWHPSVLEAARETGLSVDDQGNLREDA
ncbi:MAG: cupin domain-containing protein [Rhodospirillaceae bacterium]|nr:cupin domain-containing protein [Rhodospirillaceae bacterium]